MTDLLAVTNWTFELTVIDRYLTDYKETTLNSL